MKFKKLALGVVFASAGAFGMSSAAFADTSLSGSGGFTSQGNAAAVIQTVNGPAGQLSTNISAAAGQNSAAVTAGTQVNVNSTAGIVAATLTGSAAGSSESKTKIDTIQGENNSAQKTGTILQLGL
jgi:uncharacterized protein YaaQ